MFMKYKNHNTTQHYDDHDNDFLYMHDIDIDIDIDSLLWLNSVLATKRYVFIKRIRSDLIRSDLIFIGLNLIHEIKWIICAPNKYAVDWMVDFWIEIDLNWN